MTLPRNEIVCGDCLEVMRDWPDNCVDLVVTSPPYGDLRKYDGFKFNFKEIVKEFFRIVKKGGVVVWVIGDQVIEGSESGESLSQALYFKDIGFNLHDTMIYEKNGASVPSTNRYHQTWEYMFIFSKGRPKSFNPIKKKKNKWPRAWGQSSMRNKGGELKNKHIEPSRREYGKRFNIWKYVVGWGYTTKDEIAYEHPAIYPEQLAADHIKSWSNEDDLVLDPMNGSGTTTKMAMLLGRRYIGIDISEKYCQIARDRLEAIDTGVPAKEKRAGQLPLFSGDKT